MQSLAGLGGLVAVGTNVSIYSNDQLRLCGGLLRLLDAVDAEPGPGPGVDGIPDVGGYAFITGNASGCNSRDDVLLGRVFADGFDDYDFSADDIFYDGFD